MHLNYTIIVGVLFSATTTARSLNAAARRRQSEAKSAGTMHDGNQRIRADDLQI